MLLMLFHVDFLHRYLKKGVLSGPSWVKFFWPFFVQLSQMFNEMYFIVATTFLFCMSSLFLAYFSVILLLQYSYCCVLNLVKNILKYICTL